MSRNALVLERIDTQPRHCPDGSLITRTGEFTGLACRFCRHRCVMAVVGAEKGTRTNSASRGIAAELASNGRRVVIVRVDDLARAGSVPSVRACSPSGIPNVWVWPSNAESGVDFYQMPEEDAIEADWLGALRSEFDCLLLECSTRRLEIAALADSAVLVIEAGKSARDQVKATQRSLERNGVKLAGCILMQQR